MTAAIAVATTSQAAITGQWDFKAGNLAATIGADLNYGDQTAGTTFGTTTALGVPNIAGQVTNIMGFPSFVDEYGGYVATAGAAANGGGGNVNQYTVIMDVLFPASSAGKVRALFQTDTSVSTQKGEIYINAADQLAISGGFSGGSVTPGVWHRLAVTVDTTSTISLFVDGVNVGSETTPAGLDSDFSVASSIYLFDDANTNSQAGYIASLQFQDQKLPDGLIAVLGAPVASGILTGPPPNPYVVSESPTSDLRFPARSTIPPNPLIQIVLADGTATVATNTIQLKLNNVLVPATITRSAPSTTISYQVPTFLSSGSSNAVSLTYQDSAADNLGVKYAFFVGPYTGLPASAALPLGSASTPGFIYRVAQAPADALVGDSLAHAQQQLDGTLLNTNGIPFANEADLTQPGVQADGSYFIDQYESGNGTIAFEGTGIPFYDFPSFTTYQFPGIPGVNGSTLNFSDESLAYLQLAAGTYVFGVNVGIGRVDASGGDDDNGYILTCGANPRDYFSTVVGRFVRTGSNFSDTQNTNQFTFVAPVAGIYPFRLLHWNAGAAAVAGSYANTAAAGLYYVDPVSGNQVLVNDPAGTIPAFRASTVLREPYVAEVYPAPGGSGFAASAPIKIVLSDDDLQVAGGSPKLYLNGTQVTINSTSKAGKLTTLVYNPNASRTSVTNVVQLVYSDNAGSPHSFTNIWSFTIVAGGSSLPQVTGQWDFNNGNLTATVGNDLKYLDGPGGSTATLTKFGTCSSFGVPSINGIDANIMKVPGGAGVNGNNNFGYIMAHGISPNGGGALVNQYSIVWDMYWPGGGGTIPLFNCQNTNNAPADGSIFISNGGEIGQGGGGYTMNHGGLTAGWHRIALAVDLSQNLITKWVDGVKAQDWVSSANALDAARRAWQPTTLLFADGDGDDHDTTVYVKSIQVRNGKLADAEMVALGAPSGTGIPVTIPVSTVTGQWDFNFGDLSATVGKDLQYLDGPTGTTESLTAFGTCSSFGIPTINGNDAKIMKVPGGAGVNGNNNFGYIMAHGILPNGGGALVNQYSIVWDMYWPGGGGTIPLFNCQNTNNAPADGSIFISNGGEIGQGGGGYTMNHGGLTAGWHRIALTADLSQNLITKWVDGVKAQDWVSSANSLDAARRAWQPTVLLFADGDGDDHDTTVYVKSIQVSSGKLSDAQIVALGTPSGSAIPVATSAGPITGQWDFNFGDLSATVGKDLQYLDGPSGTTESLTAFGTCTSFGIPMINGTDGKIMKVPGGAGVNGNNNFGYIMAHAILPNGGGALVNQYTIIWDMYVPSQSGTLPFFNCQNTNNAPADGSLFLENGNMGQGGGGYTMNNGPVTVGWHRIAFAVDLSQNLITKWVDGVKAQDWVSSANGLDAARRAWQPTVLLFADGDGDDHDLTCYVKSIQVQKGKASDAWMEALGGASASGIPVAVSLVPTGPSAPPTLSIVNNKNGTVTVSWASTATGWTLATNTSLSSPTTWTPYTASAVNNNSATITLGSGAMFFRLQQ